MTKFSRLFAAVAGVLSVGSVAAFAGEAAQSNDAKIAALEAKLAALEAKQSASSKETAATIDAVLRDADRRSQLLANGADMGAGYDNGFFIRAGENFVLRPGAGFQFRNVTNYREDAESDGDDDFENGFEVRRMKFSLEGVAFTPNLTYNFTWATDREDGSLELQDAYVAYMFADDWGTRIGQFKDPVHHEELVSYKRQLAADRSLLNEVLGGGDLDRVQGVSLIYGNYNKNNPFNAEIAFHDGANTDNTSFVDVPESDWGVGGRIEYKAFGDWRAYRDFSAMGNKEGLLVLGAGADWTQQGPDNVYRGTIDAQWETAGGLGLYGAALVEHSEPDAGGDNTDWGLLVQAGYMLNPAWEVFGRYDVIFLDEDFTFAAGGSEDTFHEFTVGLNYFLGDNGSAGHRAKFTIDLTYLPESFTGNAGIGVLGNGEDGEFLLRAQFQLLI